MDVYLNGKQIPAVLNESKEIFPANKKLGFKVTMTSTKGNKILMRNSTEVHLYYNKVNKHGFDTAVESDIHGTGRTFNTVNTYILEIEDETSISDEGFDNDIII